MVIEGRARPAKAAPKKSPVASIGSIASLKRYANRDAALDMLHELAVKVAPVIHHYGFKVGALCEMFPRNPLLLGLNVNRGQKILVRLRHPHNDAEFLPMGDLVGTLLHELAHNVHGAHDAQFYKLLDELKLRHQSGVAGYVCEENRVGAAFRAPWAVPQSVREKRLRALARPVYKAEARRLGGAAGNGDLRKLAFRAAERRRRDAQWCFAEEVPHDDMHVRAMLPEVIDLTHD